MSLNMSQSDTQTRTRPPPPPSRRRSISLLPSPPVPPIASPVTSSDVLPAPLPTLTPAEDASPETSSHANSSPTESQSQIQPPVPAVFESNVMTDLVPLIESSLTGASPSSQLNDSAVHVELPPLLDDSIKKSSEAAANPLDLFDRSVFRFEPQFQLTALSVDPANVDIASKHLSLSIKFNPVNPFDAFVRVRQQWWYGWLFIVVMLWVGITEIFFSFQTSYFWYFAYFVPLFMFLYAELTESDTSIMKVLCTSFDTWLIWGNLLMMTVFAAIGSYLGGIAATSSYSGLMLNHLTLFCGGMFFTMLDSFQRTKFTWRLHLICLLCVLFTLVRIVIIDQFMRPMFSAYPICFLYCSDTRQLAMSCARNAMIFTAKITVNYIFGGQAAAILSLNLTYHRVELAHSPEYGSEVSQHTDDQSSSKCCQFGSKTLSVTHYVIASTGSPLIEESGSAALEQVEVVEMTTLPPTITNPVSEVSVSAENTTENIIPTDITTEIVDLDSSSTPATRSRSMSSRPVQLLHTHSADHAVRRDTGHVPLVSACLEYQPLCCSARTLNRIAGSTLYKFSIIAVALVVMTISIFKPNNLTLGVLAIFVPTMLVVSLFAVIEVSRLDQVLLKYLIRKFDFWFLLLSLIGYVVLSAYENSQSVNFCYANIEFSEALRSTIVSNFVFFWGNLFTFIWDAEPFVSRAVKLGFLIVALGNSFFLMYASRYSGMQVAGSFQICSVQIWFDGQVISNTNTVRFGTLITFVMFQFRNLVRQLFYPGRFAMLTVPLKLGLTNQMNVS